MCVLSYEYAAGVVVVVVVVVVLSSNPRAGVAIRVRRGRHW